MSKIFNQYIKLTLQKSNLEILQCQNIVLESGFFILEKMYTSSTSIKLDEQINDALITFQMFLGKGLAINKLINGLDFKSSINNIKIKELIDPTSIAILTRTQLEAFANFHNIYNANKDEHLRNLLYNLWVISGLKSRQSTVEEKLSEENRLKAEQEKKKIARLFEEIIENPYFSTLEPSEKKWFIERIKKRDFELQYSNGKFKKSNWRELLLSAGVNEIFTNLYKLLSISTHPTNVSVFQYAQMFEKGDNEEMAYAFLNQSNILTAFMISEFCDYFPEARVEFKSLPDINQLIIDSHNIFFRGMQFQVSNVHSKYEKEFQAEYEKRLS